MDGHLPIPHTGLLELIPARDYDEAVVPSGMGGCGSEVAEWVVNGVGQWCGGEHEGKPMRGPAEGGDRRFGRRMLDTHRG